MTEATPPAAITNPVVMLVNRPVEAKVRADELIVAVHRMPVLIEDQETAERAVDLSKMLYAHKKRLDDECKQVVGPINQGVKLIKAKFGVVTTALEIARKEVGDKITVFQIEQERKAGEVEAEARRQQEEAGLEQAQALEDAGDAAGAQEVLDYAADAPAPVVAHSKIIRSDSGATSSLRTNWDWEVVVADMIPRAYSIVDEKKVNQAVKDGERFIPGLRIFEVQKSVQR